MDKFLDIYNLPKLNHEVIENLNKWEIESVIVFQQSPGSAGLTADFYRT